MSWGEKNILTPLVPKKVDEVVVEVVDKGVVEKNVDEDLVEKDIEYGVVEKESDHGAVENEMKKKRMR